MQPYLYILASKRNGTLYVGVTSDLPKRIGEHRAGIIPGFTARYGVKRLVYLEAHSSMTEAIRRERQMKEWQRLWKLRLIERDNPRWRDLFVELFEG
tara:strand:+ start:976 stop:1266 length:291 start_codon:yes stop_codon:yes gene_type:complete